MELTARAKILLKGSLATEHDLRDLITGKVESSGSQKAVARELGYSQAYLGDVLRGGRGVSEEMAEKLGWVKVAVYLKK